MTIFPSLLFDEFCTYLNGKLKWERKGKLWTDMVFRFFSDLNKKESIPYLECKEYMNVDYIWRYDPSRYSISDIELAVEHEGQTYKVDKIIEDEIRHLVDIKARCKVGIFYPSQGDQEALLIEITKTIGSQNDIFKLQNEEYLIILGFTTTQKGKRVIQFKGFIFDSKGEIKEKKELTILQATTTRAPLRPTTTSIASNKSSYRQGENVTITGSGFPVGTQVAIQVKSPSGRTVWVDQKATDSKGSFISLFALVSDAEIGQFAVYASSVGGSATYTFLVMIKDA